MEAQTGMMRLPAKKRRELPAATGSWEMGTDPPSGSPGNQPCWHFYVQNCEAIKPFNSW